MTRHESPGYYCITGDIAEQPAAAEYVEGRIFVTDDRLVCGAGEMGAGGYADALDSYSESTVRRLFGSRFDPQEFDIDAALNHDGTATVPLSDVARSELRYWDSSRQGADRTFAVRVDAPDALEAPLLIQFGRGGRNRGTGRSRHETFAEWLEEVATGPAATRESDSSDSGAAAASEALDANRSSPTLAETAPDATPSDPAADSMLGADASGVADADSGSTGGGGDTEREPTWLDSEPNEPALIAKNRSNIRLQPQVRCRHGNNTLFIDSIDLNPGDTHRWTEFPEDGVINLDIIFDEGSRRAEQFDAGALASSPIGIELYASDFEVLAG